MAVCVCEEIGQRKGFYFGELPTQVCFVVWTNEKNLQFLPFSHSCSLFLEKEGLRIERGVMSCKDGKDLEEKIAILWV